MTQQEAMRRQQQQDPQRPSLQDDAPPENQVIPDRIEEIPAAVQRCRDFYASGQTRDIHFRKDALVRLYHFTEQSTRAIGLALKKDLNKSLTEAYMTEIGLVKRNIKYLFRHLENWSKPQKRRPDRSQFPAKLRVERDPYGTVLVVSPWNYPFLLSVEPVAAAIAAGNTVVLKPSPYSPACSHILNLMLEHGLPRGLVEVIHGGRDVNRALFDQQFDYIFFTGSPALGQEVMRKAARHLTPLTLELGGKSPCLVEKTANVPLTAKRIAFGKLLNAGQTCVAPDYILVDKTRRQELVEALQDELSVVTHDADYYRDNYPRIINREHYERLLGLMKDQNIIFGGSVTNEDRRQIEPTMISEPDPLSPLMQEEIFGPLLPIISYEKLEEALQFIEKRPKPLAFYLFSEDRGLARTILSRLAFGGGCMNDCMLHMTSVQAPFGGVGQSGFGEYHGKYSWETFTHPKTILEKPAWPDLSLRYHPYDNKKQNLLEKFLR